MSDGKTYTIKTDSNGEAVSEKLVAGDYKIKEITAPRGYELNSEEITVSVSDGNAVIKTITDKPIKTSVSVKKWIGKEADSVKIHLYADNKDTGKSVVLDKTNIWKGKFDNLRKFNKDGNENKYTVKEDTLSDYESNVTGSQKDGYLVTNKNIEKIRIPVTKKRVGKAADSVTVNLLADNKDTGKSITLNSASQWKGEFKDILKYDGTDGHEIVYTVSEVSVKGIPVESAKLQKTALRSPIRLPERCPYR